MPRPNRTYEKPKDFKGSLKKLFLFCKPIWIVFIISAVFAGFGAILSVLGPNILKDLTNEIINNIMTGINMNNIARLGLIMLAIYLISALFDMIQGLMMSKSTHKVLKKLRTDINHKINKLPLSYIDSNAYGTVMSKSTNDVDAIGRGLNDSVSNLIWNLCLLVACLIMMFVTNWIMALTAIVSCLVGFALIIVIAKNSQKHFAQQQKNLGDINGHIEEIFTAHDIVNIYNSKEIKKEKFKEYNQNLCNSTWKAGFFGGMLALLMGFIGNLGYVAICVVGGILVSKNVITTGVIVAFMLYVRLFSNPLTQLAQCISNLQTSVAASERVFELLEEKEIKQGVSTIEFNSKNASGNVVFDDVSFGYNQEELVIKNFSADIKSGQKVALVGPTGSGKTTIVNLLMRFYEISSGKISIDGKDIASIDRNDLHNTFGMVLQDTWLFEGTVRENLVYNQKDVSKEQLDKVCEDCSLTHFIKTLPNGYDTVLDDNTNISQGQKQLLTIARAMVQNCPMLILDEATSSIDTRTEIMIQKAIDKLTKDRTTFVIAHRLSTIKNADLILVLKNGEIIERGNHKQLLKQDGFYAQLYKSQFVK